MLTGLHPEAQPDSISELAFYTTSHSVLRVDPSELLDRDTHRALVQTRPTTIPRAPECNVRHRSYLAALNVFGVVC